MSASDTERELQSAASESPVIPAVQTEPAAPADEPHASGGLATASEALFSAEYATDLPLLTGYVDLLVGDKQRRFALVMAGIDIVLAIVVAIAAAPMWPIALVLAAIGIGMFWYRGNVCRMTATKMLRGLDPAELHRQVHVYTDHVALVKDDGSVDDFPISELTSVMHNDQLLVMAFGRSGVTVPSGSLTKGTYEELLAWALERAGESGAPAGAAPQEDAKEDATPKED